MNILILGASGFIGKATVLRLLADGHAVTGLSRSIAKSKAQIPAARWISADLADMVNSSDWSGVLGDTDVVINCAGALQDGLADNLDATQKRAMTALYAAAKQKADVNRGTAPLIIQISAPKNLNNVPTAFMATKLAADQALTESGLPHVILRPTMVIGRNAHGGSALIRALAAFPVVTPLINADKRVDVVHLDQVTDAVASAVNGTIKPQTDIVLSTSEAMSLRDLVLLHRRWLGLGNAPIINLSPIIAAPAIALADLAGYLGWRSPLRSTAKTIMNSGITSETGVDPSQRFSKTVQDLLLASPAGVQDLWFARLYLLKPLIIIILSLFWLLSGIIPLFDATTVSMRFQTVFSPGMSFGLTIATSLADILLGLSVLFRPASRRAMLGMIGLSIAYLVSGTLIEPALWADPLGPLVKVFPSIALTLAALAILEER